MNRIRKNILAMLLISGSLCSCDPVIYAIPEENPIILSCEAQTVTTKIKELDSMFPQDPESDKDIYYDESKPHWSKIENEWITFYCEWTPNRTEKVKITVNENTSPQERRYVLGIKCTFRKSSLTVIQEGKNE